MANMTSPLLIGVVAIKPNRFSVNPTCTLHTFNTSDRHASNAFSRFVLIVSKETALLAVSRKATSLPKMGVLVVVVVKPDTPETTTVKAATIQPSSRRILDLSKWMLDKVILPWER
jgi:hypothetical protein